ncbi:hypothetical protein BASA50_002234 [Batrachochytrium salamandrivorans]|uniref:Uncharacterized protein n=1 Tax=Batrachochytrium salamandrivorans TaxID=1357716 RepID=A0ABQ8FLX7_9FUNG|nr:hypothetical protein BASA50_002234 [Batrachochytrium salamandrivorans]
MKLLALSLIAMFMVTVIALIIPVDSMDDASGLVKRQNPVPVSAPTDDPVLNRAFFSTPTDDPTPSITPVLKSTPTHVLRSDSTSPPVLRFTPTPNPKPIFSDIL